MMKIKPYFKEEYLFIAAIVVVALVIAFLFFKKGVPAFSAYQGFRKEAAKRQEELQARKATIVQIERLKKDVQQIDREFRDFTQKIILEPGTFEATKVITDLASGLKLEFLFLQPLETRRIELSARKDETFLKFLKQEKKEFYLLEIPVTVKLKANFANITAFIKRIEGSMRFLKIERLEVKKDAQAPLLEGAELVVSMFSMPG